jgi:hypothetical protein
LREYKEEILEAHRSGLSVHRIAQIFREHDVDISVPHLVRTVRRFVDEEERVAGRSPLLILCMYAKLFLSKKAK